MTGPTTAARFVGSSATTSCPRGVSVVVMKPSSSKTTKTTRTTSTRSGTKRREKRSKRPTRVVRVRKPEPVASGFSLDATSLRATDVQTGIEQFWPRVHEEPALPRIQMDSFVRDDIGVEMVCDAPEDSECENDGEYEFDPIESVLQGIADATGGDVGEKMAEELCSKPSACTLEEVLKKIDSSFNGSRREFLKKASNWVTTILITCSSSSSKSSRHSATVAVIPTSSGDNEKDRSSKASSLYHSKMVNRVERLVSLQRTLARTARADMSRAVMCETMTASMLGGLAISALQQQQILCIAAQNLTYSYTGFANRASGEGEASSSRYTPSSTNGKGRLCDDAIEAYLPMQKDCAAVATDIVTQRFDMISWILVAMHAHNAVAAARSTCADVTSVLAAYCGYLASKMAAISSDACKMTKEYFTSSDATLPFARGQLGVCSAFEQMLMDIWTRSIDSTWDQPGVTIDKESYVNFLWSTRSKQMNSRGQQYTESQLYVDLIWSIMLVVYLSAQWSKHRRIPRTDIGKVPLCPFMGDMERVAEEAMNITTEHYGALELHPSDQGNAFSALLRSLHKRPEKSKVASPAAMCILNRKRAAVRTMLRGFARGTVTPEQLMMASAVSSVSGPVPDMSMCGSVRIPPYQEKVDFLYSMLNNVRCPAFVRIASAYCAGNGHQLPVITSEHVLAVSTQWLDKTIELGAESLENCYSASVPVGSKAADEEACERPKSTADIVNMLAGHSRDMMERFLTFSKLAQSSEVTRPSNRGGPLSVSDAVFLSTAPPPNAPARPLIEGVFPYIDPKSARVAEDMLKSFAPTRGRPQC